MTRLWIPLIVYTGERQADFARTACKPKGFMIKIRKHVKFGIEKYLACSANVLKRPYGVQLGEKMGVYV
ncbi:hypothetical protein [Bacillus sp. FJAT-27445]|uniref:hypothetical protein n=1 Tax=Bacillus sp. FJAT-27445 TaxID=1679166 RepID=UPI00074323E2|nr:hypothetical protein [Bacillus sp. FJAT-27445]